MMKPSSSFYRSIKHIISSSSFSSFGDIVHGSSLAIFRHYHPVPAAIIGVPVSGIDDDSQPFSIINHYLIPGLWDTWRNKNASCEILRPGMILLKSFVNILGQTGIVEACEKLGVGPGGFYVPSNRSGHKLQRHITSFGRNWDPVTGYNNQYRSDGSEPPAIPHGFISLINSAIEVAQAHMDELPSMYPDSCLVSFYSTCDRLDLHQDHDESADSLKKELPVVLVSVGDTIEFWYGDTRDENKLGKILLESGDILIYGGKSRLIFHGVKRILHGTIPPDLEKAVMIRPGHLNLTLKQF
ncbi:hypothetical protein QVD17_29427 [Tagetes erecta]|uniref:Alpha-ketoglutarate-dependent dioxygenase AlkB-like domain-containing protein n=1 Tax=Tagetes erecta TaxID=13708 RepID=A0AAD8KBR2_TARER|nr:hypothetical protein QVD17_29427 [Tagetes erecta]